MRIIDSKCEKTPNLAPTDSSKKLLLEIYEDKSFIQKASKGFNDPWLTRQFSGITIVVGKAEFKVHKAVLAMQNEVFAALFKKSWKKERPTN